MTMFHNKFKMMSFLFKATFVFVFIPCCFSAPVETPNDTLYAIFVAEMTQKNCTLPSQIPVSFASKETSLEASLQICNIPDYVKYNKEVKLLCNEIFGLLKNITCSPQNVLLPSIHIPLSDDVCKDFAVYKTVLPAGLLSHLSDSFDCKLMCADDIEESCKVLLWSFLVQSQMKDSQAHETVKTLKTQSETAGNPAPKLQGNSEIEQSNDQKPQAKLDESPSNGLKTQELTSILSSKEVKTLPDKSQEIPVQTNGGSEIQEPNGNLDTFNSKDSKVLNVKDEAADAVATEPAFQTNSINNPDGETRVETEQETTLKINGVIPIKSDFNVPESQNKEEPNPDGNLENKNPPVQIPVEPKDETNEANKVKTDLLAKPAAELKETNPDISNKAVVEDPKEEDARKPEVHEPATSVFLNQKESHKTIQENNANSEKVPETDQKAEVTEKKVDDSAAIVKIPDPLTNEATPSADSVPETVSVAVSESLPSPTSVASVVATPSLEKMDDEIPLPNEKDTDQYNDLDNGDGDLDQEYSKQEFGDTNQYEPSKNKEALPETSRAVEIPQEPIIPQTQDIKGFNELSPRDSYGRSSDEIQVLAAFPDQEDSHFFFYFLSIVLILMAGYLIFHNKQKIIALIVEGRHERRRRSHGLGYKKLETK